MRILAACLILVCLLAACGGESPEFLAYTPGAPFTVSDQRYANDLFTVTVPPGWQIITSPAEDPQAVFFLRGECEIISVASAPTPPAWLNCNSTEWRSRAGEITLDSGVRLALFAAALGETWDEVEGIYDDVAASVHSAAVEG